MIDGRCAVVAAMCLVAALPAGAQSLADVARQEATRRDAVTQAAKTYTNADLDADPLATPVSAPVAGEPEPGGYMSISAGRYVTADELIALSNANIPTAEKALQEPNWRSQADTLRSQLLKIRREAEAMASTSADEARSPSDRAAADRMLTLRRTVVEDLERRWAKLERQAEIQRIPRAWLDPRPKLSTETPQ